MFNYSDMYIETCFQKQVNCFAWTSKYFAECLILKMEMSVSRNMGEQLLGEI